jgi:endonuclease/exonuclease/phosphatase family metal-dependent hydrolase
MRAWGVSAVLISTYNVKNLFLCGEGPTKPHKEVRPLARMIDQVGADVMVLQEVGSLRSLQQLNQQLARPYEYADLVPGNSNRSIHIAVLSRLPMVLKSHKDHGLKGHSGEALEFYPDTAAATVQRSAPLAFARDVVRVDIRTATWPAVSLFALHLKSRTNAPWQILAADDMRQAECRALVNIVNAYVRAHPDACVAVLGDFNDRMSSDALAPLKVLNLSDPLGAKLRLSGRNPSTYWPKRRMRIDHILVNQRMLSLVEPDSPQIHVSQMARTASDHYPVSLCLSPADVGHNDSFVNEEG